MKNLIIDFDNTLASSSELAYTMECEEEQFDTRDIKFSYKDLGWGFEPYLCNEAASHAIHVIMDRPEFFERLKPIGKIKAMRDCIQLCKNKGFKAYVCTAREHKVYPYLREWCDKNFPGLIDDIIIKKPGSFDKAFINGDIIIDDKPECLIGDRKLRILFGEALYTRTELWDLLKAFNERSLDIISGLKIAPTWENVYQLLVEYFNDYDFDETEELF